jgi:hypothetical protein
MDEALGHGLINLRSSRIPTRSSGSRRSSRGQTRANRFRSTPSSPARPKGDRIQGATKLHRLVANRRYFGLEAQSFGPVRARARTSVRKPPSRRESTHTVWAIFASMPRPARRRGELLMGGLPGWRRRVPSDQAFSTIRPRMRGRPVVARCEALIDRAHRPRINAEAVRNPFRSDMVAVSGGCESSRSAIELRMADRRST